MKLDYDYTISPPVTKFVKKLKDKRLKKMFTDAIFDEILIDPYAGREKVGDLFGFYT